MKFASLIILFFLFSISCYSQRELFNQKYTLLTDDFNLSEDELLEIKTKGKIEVFNEVKHKTSLAKTLLKSRVGKSKTFKSDYINTTYTIESKVDVPHYRVRYIYVNKAKFETEELLNNYLTKIRGLLNETNFKSVAMQYSMDYKKNVGGDSGWFKEGKTHPDFFAEVTNNNRLADEIFEFEIEETNGYYFVKKSFSAKDITEVLVVYTKEKK